MGTLRYLAQRRDGLGKFKGQRVFYASPALAGRIKFDELCKELSDGSTVDVADVKAVLSRLSVVLTRLTGRGHSVECGELGTFRPSFSGKAVPSLKEVTAENISKPKIIFTPKPEFRQSLHGASFEALTDEHGGIVVREGTKKPNGGLHYKEHPATAPSTSNATTPSTANASTGLSSSQAGSAPQPSSPSQPSSRED